MRHLLPLLPLLPFIALIALWWAVAAAGWYPPTLLVSPQRVLLAAQELLASQELQAHLAISLQRLGAGLALGTALGLVVGTLMAVSPLADRLIGPTFHAVRQVPSVALIPVLILLLGVDELFKVVIITKAAIFPVALAAAEAVRGVSAAHLDVARAWRLRRRTVLLRVLLPATVPDLVTGFRLAAGRAWGTLVAAELIASDIGLGQMMEFGRQMFRMDVVMLGLVLAGGIGFAMDRALKQVEARFSGWKAAS